MKVWQVYSTTRKELDQIGVEDSESEARFITSWICRVPAGRISLEGNFEVKGVSKRLERVLSRRRKREPLQLIMGKWEFYGREFFLEKGVLIPRHETEVLVEEAVSRLRRVEKEIITGLEVGSGAGNVCVTLLSEIENVKIVAVDVSKKAVHVTKKNARVHGVIDRIGVKLGNFKDLIKNRARFDFIISNPPYLSKKDFLDAMPEVKDYEPEEALVGGETGLECISDLIRFSGNQLVSGGYLFFEFGFGQKDGVREIFEDDKRFIKCEIIEDLASIPRVVIARRR